MLDVHIDTNGKRRVVVCWTAILSMKKRKKERKRGKDVSIIEMDYGFGIVRRSTQADRLLTFDCHLRLCVCVCICICSCLEQVIHPSRAHLISL